MATHKEEKATVILTLIDLQINLRDMVKEEDKIIIHKINLVGINKINDLLSLLTQDKSFYQESLTN